MRLNIVGAFIRNFPFGSEIAFQKGLERFGVSVNTIDPSYDNQKFDHDADATLVFKYVEREDYKRELLKLADKPCILYQPDDYRFPHIKTMVREMRQYCDYILTFDQFGADNAKKDCDYKLAEEMLLTADPDIYSYKPFDESKKDIDFCFVGSFTGGPNHASRRKMCDILASNGYKVGVASDIYDVNEISEIYARTKVVLNHATDVGQAFGTGWGYQCRHFEAGMVGACLLSNFVLDDMGTDKLRGFYCFSDESALLCMAEILLSSAEIRKLSHEELYENICARHLPVHRANEIVSFIERCNNV